GPELSRRAEGSGLSLYAELAPIALGTQPPHDEHGLLAALRAMPAATLRYRLLGAAAPPNQAMVSPGAFDRAIEGDAAAQAELLAAMGTSRTTKASITRLVTATAEDSKAAVVDLVAAWADRVFPAFVDDAMPVLARDLDTRRRRLGAGDPRDAVLDAL